MAWDKANKVVFCKHNPTVPGLLTLPSPAFWPNEIALWVTTQVETGISGHWWRVNFILIFDGFGNGGLSYTLHNEFSQKKKKSTLHAFVFLTSISPLKLSFSLQPRLSHKLALHQWNDIKEQVSYLEKRWWKNPDY